MFPSALVSRRRRRGAPTSSWQRQSSPQSPKLFPLRRYSFVLLRGHCLLCLGAALVVGLLLHSAAPSVSSNDPSSPPPSRSPPPSLLGNTLSSDASGRGDANRGGTRGSRNRSAVARDNVPKPPIIARAHHGEGNDIQPVDFHRNRVGCAGWCDAGPRARSIQRKLELRQGLQEHNETDVGSEPSFDVGACAFLECRGCDPCLQRSAAAMDARSRQPAGVRSPPTLWHISIPKTGSTTMNAILSSAAVPLRHCSIPSKLLPALEAGLSRSAEGVCAPPDPVSVDDLLHRAGTYKSSIESDVWRLGCEVLSSEWDMGVARSLQDAVGDVGFGGEKGEFLSGGIRPTIGTFTMLREPIARAVSEANHMVTHGRIETSRNSNQWNSSSLLSLLSRIDCVHSASFCASLSEPQKCSTRGSCGLFQNFQSLYLAGWSPQHRSLPDLVRLSTDDEYLLEEATSGLESIEAFGLLEHVKESVCVLAHTFGWTETFNACCGVAGEAGRSSDLCASIEGTKKNARDYARPNDEVLSAAADSNSVDVLLYARAEEIFWQRVQEVEKSARVKFSSRPSRRKELNGVNSQDQQLRIKNQEGWSATSDNPLQIYEEGLAVYAVGQSELKKAAKSFSSAKAVYGPSLRTTVFTDAPGLEWVRKSAHAIGHPFDRAINVLGRTTRVETMKRYYDLFSVDEADESRKSVQAEDADNVMNCLSGQAVKEGKIMAFRAAARMHHRFVFTDSDVIHCDSRAIGDMLGILRRQPSLGLIFASNAQNKCSSPYGHECELWMGANYPGIHAEVNSGVVACNGDSPFVGKVLTEWQEQYRSLSGTPCGSKGQDQKPLRVALHRVLQANGADPAGASANESSTVLFLWEDPTHLSYGYEPSAVPYNCRARGGQTREGQKRDKRGICQHPMYRHCSVVHGHLRASANVDTAILEKTMIRPGEKIPWEVIAFPHIPKTGGHAFKKTFLNVLASAMNTTKQSININNGVQLFKDPDAFRKWDPPRILHGAFSGDVCRWLRMTDFHSPEALAGKLSLRPRTCGYITILRDPIDRLVSEMNYCEEVGWTGEQACTGENGALEFRNALAEARQSGGPGEALAVFAERRGNVLLEHVAGPLTAADFLQEGQPKDWHKRDLEVRVNPMEMRRRRQGWVNEADLALGKLLLSSQFAVVGLLDRLEETYERILHAVLPELIGRVNTTALIEAGLKDSHDHNTFRNADAPRPCNRSEISPEHMARIADAVRLDIELYAHAKYLFDLATNLSQWDEELGSLEKQEQVAYGLQYQAAVSTRDETKWELSPLRKCFLSSSTGSSADAQHDV